MARRRVLLLLLLLCSCLLSLRPPCCSGKPTIHDDSNPGQTSNPITVPSTNPAPTIITVPSTNPTITTPSLNPLPTPITAPSIDPSTTPVPVTYPLPTPSTSAPITNPTTTPSTFPPSAPLTNPATNPVTPAVSTPPLAPITTPVTAPVVSGQQTWCVSKSGSTEAALQNALDYACGSGRADCSPIQPSGSCYYPNTLEDHASYAFNNYYQRNPAPSSCDFGGTAMLVNSNPSSGSCVLASSMSSPSSSTAGYNPTTPTTNPATTASGSDPGSSVLNASGSGITGSPDFGSDIPGAANTGIGWRSVSPSYWSCTTFFFMLAMAYMNGML